MTLPYDITEPRDALVSILGEQWWKGTLDIPTLCVIVDKFDQWTRKKDRERARRTNK